MTYRKKLIEVALPLEAINKASAREKSIRHGHPSTLHLWWARRPLAACRAVIFTSLVDDPDDPDALPEFVEACRQLPKGKNATANDTPRRRLFDFIERLVLWESTTDEEVLETARELIRIATGGNPPPLLDPFAGGGSIPLEAQRLGLEAHASDLNPVAVMINKAMIEIPPKFANMPPVNPRDRAKVGGKSEWKGAAGLAADVRYYGEWMRDKAWERIGHLYPKHNGETVIAWTWARTVKCPNPACGATAPLIGSYWLSKKKGNHAWIVPSINYTTKIVDFKIRTGTGKPSEPPKMGRGVKFRCIVCDEAIPEEHIKSEGMAKGLGTQMTAIISEGQGRRNYHTANKDHKQTAINAQPDWEPSFDMSTHSQYMAPVRYGMTQFSDLFSARQLVALNAFSKLVTETRDQIIADSVEAGMLNESQSLESGGNGAKAYSDAVSIYLAFSVSRLANRGSTLCIWNTGGEKIEQVFARQVFPITWDYPEANPFSNSTGNWLANIVWIAKTLERLPRKPVQGSVFQRDAKQSYGNEKKMVISTDPPYYDNVPYADLSDYFYTWLRHILGSIYKSVFETILVPKSSELVADHKRYGGRDKANAYFEEGLQSSFENVLRIVDRTYPVTIYYAFKQAELVVDISEGKAISNTGWETMLEGVIRAGFAIIGTWPVRTERPTGVKSRQNVLASSIVLVCRPRPEDAPWTSRHQFVQELRQELPKALKEMQSGNIAPVDLAQASIGPGMAVYSKYSKVLEPNGDPVTVRTALQLINQ